MRAFCNKLQKVLAEKGIETLDGNKAAIEHLESCVECRAVRAALIELEKELAELPTYDVTDNVVSGLKAKIAFQNGAPKKTARRHASWFTPRVGLGLSGALASVMAVMVVVRQVGERAKQEFAPIGNVAPQIEIERQLAAADSSDSEQVVLQSGATHSETTRMFRVEKGARKEESALANNLQEEATFGGSFEPEEAGKALKSKQDVGDLAYRRDQNAPSDKAPAIAAAVGNKRQDLFDLRDESATKFAESRDGKDSDRNYLPPQQDVATEIAGGERDALSESKPASMEVARSRESNGADYAKIYSDELLAKNGELSDGKQIVVEMGEASAASAEGAGRGGTAALASSPAAIDVVGKLRNEKKSNQEKEQPKKVSADEFSKLVAERTNTTGLIFRSAQGYFANTYLPGDAAIRALQARLESWDRTALEKELGSVLQLERSVMPASQPFDAPRDSALAVYVHSDRAKVSGQTRMLLQVGVKASDRKNALRQPLSLTVIADARGELSANTKQALRALVDALAQAKNSGDHFRLLIVGRGKEGIIDVRSENFRHGPLTLALKEALEGKGSKALDLAQVIDRATAELLPSEKTEGVSASSAILMALPSGTGKDLKILEHAAQSSAIKGVPVSVVGLGSEANLDSFNQVVFAGQGRRSVLQDVREAKALVERELLAQSTVVARALRLNIKLAPGVKLVDVLGTTKLGTAETKRVKYIEERQDSLISKNFGIEADRGTDDAGIQILIPAFYSGDSHVLLLDVVADSSNVRDNQREIAQVSLRFKDLLQLKNGRVEKSFALASGQSAPLWQGLGPLEQNVVKNFISYRVSESLKAAGRALSRRDLVEARKDLTQANALLVGAMHSVQALGDDTDLKMAREIIRQYLAILNNEGGQQLSALLPLGESLQLAAYNLLVGPIKFENVK